MKKWHFNTKQESRMRQKLATGAGFTIFEIIVSISLFVVVILMTGSLYQISQKSYNKGSDGAELTQNARVSLDRLSRELRQATDIMTGLPETDQETGFPPPAEILFRDGHDISKITYIKYYLENNNLMRRHTAYYFGTDRSIYVPYGSLDIYGDPASELNLEVEGPRIIGEYFNVLRFWGANKLINISMELAKNQNKLNAETKIYTKN